MNKPTKKPSKIINRSNQFNFHRCPICKAMHEGKANTVEDLKKAFRQAENRQKWQISK